MTAITNLSKYTNKEYNPGRKLLTRFVWMLQSRVIIETWFSWPYALKRFLLRIFGANIGKRVIIKPKVCVKYPWKLQVGDNCWLGEGVWIDNLCEVKIGNNVCISQGAYLTTGSHDHTKSTFDLIVKPIIIEDGVWIGAKSIILPGSIIKSHAVIAAGAVFSGVAKPYTVYIGNPATAVYKREVK